MLKERTGAVWLHVLPGEMADEDLRTKIADEDLRTKTADKDLRIKTADKDHGSTGTVLTWHTAYAERIPAA